MRLPARWTARRRRRLADLARDPAVRAYLREPPVPDRTPLADLPLLAVDLETTGLDPQRDEILSIGLVPVDGRRIMLTDAAELLVRPSGGVGSSATIHGLTDDRVAAGMPLSEALAVLLRNLEGRLLLGHHAALEVGFLQTAAKQLAGVAPPIPSVCTLQLEQRSFERRRVHPVAGALRLAATRRRHGLPDAGLHDALADALACAELYLVQTADLLARDPDATAGVVRRR